MGKLMCSENTMFMFENAIMKSIVTLLLTKTREGDLSISLKNLLINKRNPEFSFLINVDKKYFLYDFCIHWMCLSNSIIKQQKTHRTMYSEDSDYRRMLHQKSSTKATL